MKSFLKKVLFNSDGNPNRIRSGISAGMLTSYDPQNRGLHLLGLYEREIYSFVKKGINKADTLIDIGANDGFYGMAFSRFKNKKIILCEPGEQELKDLRHNLALNGLKENNNLVIVDKFISDKSGINEMSVNDLFTNTSKAFVLMDVDGVELKILGGFNFELDKQIDWLIETHSVALETGVSELLRRNGYHVEIIKNAWWRKFIPEKRPLEHNRWLYASKNS